MSKRITKALVCLLFLLLFAGCESAPYKLSFAKKQPRVKDMVGTWVPTKETLKIMPKLRGRAMSKLILRRNGRFLVSNMPDWWHFDAPPKRSGITFSKYRSGSGRWGIVKPVDAEIKTWEVMLEFPTDWYTFNIANQAPPYLIHQYVTDSTSGAAMIFEKQ